MVSGGGGGGGFCFCLWLCLVGDTWSMGAGAGSGLADGGGATAPVPVPRPEPRRFSSERSFLETEVLILNRFDPNNLDKKFPSWSFCFSLALFLLRMSSWTPVAELTSRNILSRLLDLFLALWDRAAADISWLGPTPGQSANELFSSRPGSCKLANNYTS